jgi:hypothetical protein
MKVGIIGAGAVGSACLTALVVGGGARADTRRNRWGDGERTPPAVFAATGYSVTREETRREALSTYSGFLDRHSLAGRLGVNHRPDSCARLTTGWVRGKPRTPAVAGAPIIGCEDRLHLSRAAGVSPKFTRLNWAWSVSDLIALVRSRALACKGRARMQ